MGSDNAYLARMTTRLAYLLLLLNLLGSCRGPQFVFRPPAPVAQPVAVAAPDTGTVPLVPAAQAVRSSPPGPDRLRVLPRPFVVRPRRPAEAQATRQPRRLVAVVRLRGLAGPRLASQRPRSNGFTDVIVGASLALGVFGLLLALGISAGSTAAIIVGAVGVGLLVLVGLLVVYWEGQIRRHKPWG